MPSDFLKAEGPTPQRGGEGRGAAQQFPPSPRITSTSWNQDEGRGGGAPTNCFFSPIQRPFFCHRRLAPRGVTKKGPAPGPKPAPAAILSIGRWIVSVWGVPLSLGIGSTASQPVCLSSRLWDFMDPMSDVEWPVTSRSLRVVSN